ncbi:renal dipeptidase family protein, partial [Pseudomonas savastanoi pv. glycinea str. race 4]
FAAGWGLMVVDEARHQQEVRYKIITGMVRDFPNQVG